MFETPKNGTACFTLGSVFGSDFISSFFAQDTPPINASFWVERNAPPLSQVKQLWHIALMGVHLSIKAKLVLAAGAGKELKSAMEEFNRACNTLSELAFQRDLHRKYDIHHEGYRLIREETNLPSQHVVNAIAKVSAVYTRDQNKWHQFKLHSSVRYCRTSMDDPLQGGQGRCGGRGSFASVHLSDLFAMFASGCPS